MSKPIMFPVEFMLPTLKSDGSATLKFGTRELEPNEVAIIHEHRNKVGWMLFKENEITAEELPKTDADLENKSQSQRLRAVLYVLWKDKKSQGDQRPFEDFYRQSMEGLIDKIKEKLPEGNL